MTSSFDQERKTMYDEIKWAKLDKLVGRHATGVLWSEDRVSFVTDEGTLTYEVDGDCCSHSYLYDFYGVDHLRHGWPITNVEAHELQEGDPGYLADESDGDAECTRVYGYRLTVRHPTLGPVTAVFSFRNESNGYYGGDIRWVDGEPAMSQRAIAYDVVGD